MKHLLTFFLLLLTLTAPAQRHVRGRFPRHVKALRMDEALLDTTHTVVAVDGAWQGLQLPQAFTGKDVMMGVTDVGFDFTHPTFRQSHWVGFWDLLSRDTLHSHTPVFTGRDYSADEMRDLQHSYDALDHTHGTLVLGTAAGGDATYRGMAFEADVLVVNTVLSNNAYMADSLQRPKLDRNFKFDEFAYIFDQASRMGKPCVINMSAGSRQSFGDEFGLYNRKIDELVGPGRIIVAAAGNGGQQLAVLRKQASQQRVGSRVDVPKSEEVFYMFYQSEGDAVRRLWLSNDGGATLLPLPDNAYESIDTISDYDGRPVEYLVFYRERFTRLGIQQFYATIEGTGEGQLFTQNVLFVNSGRDDGFNDADNGYSLHFPSAYDNVISVANIVHRDEIVNYRGERVPWFEPEGLGERGRWCRYSSVGPRLDGYQKPDISAPGCFIVTSVSSFMEEAHPKHDGIQNDKQRFTDGGRTYAWRADSGTSLSAPIVAGIIALWLQANPNLTPQDIKDIFRRTARHPDPSLTYPNAIYGYGEIDAYAGLLDIIGGTRIDDVSRHQPCGVRFTVEGSDLHIHFAQPSGDVRVRVYTTGGQLVHTDTLTDASGTRVIPLAGQAHGVYVVQLDAADPQAHGSTLIRI